jgi:hypothetical protein
VVDDSIIDVENIFRRLRETKRSPNRPVFSVVLDASLEVRRAVVFATFIVALIFLPVLTLTGPRAASSRHWRSAISSLVASLLVALTILRSLLFFDKGVRKPDEPRLQHWLKTIIGNPSASLPAGRASSSPPWPCFACGGDATAVLEEDSCRVSRASRPPDFCCTGALVTRDAEDRHKISGELLRTNISRRLTNRWAAPNWAKTRGDRIAASFTWT